MLGAQAIAAQGNDQWWVHFRTSDCSTGRAYDSGVLATSGATQAPGSAPGDIHRDPRHAQYPGRMRCRGRPSLLVPGTGDRCRIATTETTCGVHLTRAPRSSCKHTDGTGFRGVRQTLAPRAADTSRIRIARHSSARHRQSPEGSTARWPHPTHQHLGCAAPGAQGHGSRTSAAKHG